MTLHMFRPDTDGGGNFSVNVHLEVDPWVNLAQVIHSFIHFKGSLGQIGPKRLQ